MDFLRRIAKIPNEAAQTRRYCISVPTLLSESAFEDCCRYNVKIFFFLRNKRLDLHKFAATVPRELVKLERQGSVFVISLNRPHKRNAINKDMAAALRHAFQTFETDDTATVGVLHGIGGSFSSGYDMKEFFEESVKPASLFPTVSKTINPFFFQGKCT